MQHHLVPLRRQTERERRVAFITVTHDDRLAQEADREDGWLHELDKQEHRKRLLRNFGEA